MTWFSPSILWKLGIKLRWSDLTPPAFTLWATSPTFEIVLICSFLELVMSFQVPIGHLWCLKEHLQVLCIFSVFLTINKLLLSLPATLLGLQAQFFVWALGFEL